MLNENYHSLFSFNQVKKTIEKLLPHPRFKVIEGLITLDLPLSDELEDDYQAAVETGNNYLKTVRKLPILLNQVKFQKLNQVKFQTLIKNRYRKLTLGEGIDLKELKFYLNAHSHEIKINENSVELLANGIKEYSFRLVNKRLYLIKRYDGKPY